MTLIVRPATTNDLNFINAELISQNTIRHINDDITITKQVQVTDPTGFIIVEDLAPVGFFLMVPQNSITVDIHTSIRACKNKKLAAELCEQYIKSIGFVCVTSHIPEYNKAALIFAQASGFDEVGFIPDSYLFRGGVIGQYIVSKFIGEKECQ